MDRFTLNFAYRQTQVRSNSFLILHTTYGTMPVQYVGCSEKLITLIECNEYQYEFCVLAEDVPAGLDICNITPDIIIDPYLTPNNTLNLESSESNTIGGTGTVASPYTVNLNVDPIVGNLIEVTAAGVKVILPDDGFTAADRIKLDGIEDNATRDQTAAEIKVAYESNVNTNAFTDAQETKLNGLPADAAPDQTGAEIVALIDAEPDANLLSDAEVTKLTNIEENADVTDADNVGAAIAGATQKSNLVAADLFAISDSEAGGVLRGTTFAALQSALGVVSTIIKMSDVKPDSTVGGQAVATSWNPRDINTKNFDPSNAASLDQIPFTAGGPYEILPLDTITGGTSGATALVHSVVLTSGAWGTSDAAGILWVNDILGTFLTETIDVGVNIGVASITGADPRGTEIRLTTGTWAVNASAPANNLGNTVCAIYNVTDSVYLATGQNAYAGTTAGDSQVNALCNDVFTIASPKTIEVHQWSTDAGPVDGLGIPNGIVGNDEIYTSLSITGI